MENEDTLRLAISEGDREIYNELRTKGMPLFGIENSEIFLIAMAIGLRYGRKPLEGSRDQFIQGQYLKSEEKSIIKAIAMFEEESLDVLRDSKKVYLIAEEYATRGIEYLKEMNAGRGSFSKKLVSELLEVIEENEKEILES